MKTTALSATLLAAALAFPCFAQSPSDGSPERAAVIANDRAYEAAYAKADANALLDFFAEDAEYLADNGRLYKGHAEIGESIKAAFRANKGAKLAIQIDAVRTLSPEVVLERGTTTVTSKNGETSGALFSATHVKKDGKWKISHLVETPLPEASPSDHLAELDWLIGDWEETDKSNDLSVRSQYVRARGGNFITRNVTVKRAGEIALEGWQVIGWDPVEETIRSWTFDSEGGFSEGTWIREGDRWLVRESGVAPDGSRTAADSTFTKSGADRLTWESNNRTLDGQPQPSIGRIEINRVKGS
jgi:uncharacterized protein (TIGR02246 family)